MPSRVVPEDVGAKVHTLVPWQYPLIVPDIELPPIVYLLKAAFKFNVGELDGELDEELSPPPLHAVNRTVEIRDKPRVNLALFNIFEVALLNIIFHQSNNFIFIPTLK